MRAAAVLVVLAVLTAGCLTGKNAPSAPPPGATAGLFQDCSVFPGMGNASWQQTCAALASPNDSDSKSEVDVAVNPTDPLNIVVASKDRDRKASDCVWAVAQVTKDGGKTWTTVYIGGDRSDRAPELTGYQCITDPIMVFDAEGVLYYSLQAYEYLPKELPVDVPQVPVVGTPSPGSTITLARSRDGGLTWDRFVPQHEGEGFVVFHDYMRMLVNPATGSVYTVWNALRNFGGPPPYYVSATLSATRDGGETVAPPVSIVAEDAPTSTQFFSGFAATKEGDVYVTINKGEDTDGGAETNVWLFKSTDDARSFTEVGKAFSFVPTPRQHGDHEFRTPSFVELAIDTSDGDHSGRLYLFWPAWDAEKEESDVMSSWSDDAVTWSPPVNVAVETAGDQLFMRPAVGPDGAVHVLVTTQAYSGSELLDQVLATSRDGGATWTNLRLTNVSYDGDLGIHQDGFPFIGDYNGLVVDPSGAVHAAWADTSTGRAEIAYARVRPT